MADPETNDSSPPCFSNLLCQEDSSYLNEREQEQESAKPYCCFISEEEDEYIESMFNRESFFFGFGSETCSAMGQAWFKSARSSALDWIFNTREKLGFNFRTLYLSITYFDRFLSKRHIDSGKIWAIRLLSVACLSLAAKIEECHVPMLSEFPFEDYEFESKVIQRMELLVLSELEWKMGSLTPFSYLNYFVNKFGADKGLVSGAVELILAMARETNLTDNRPSIVAACTLLVASDGQLTRETIELKMSVIKFWRSRDMEDVYSCCDLLKEIERRKVKTPPESSLSPNVVLMLDNTLLNSASTSKRRLTFNESGHSNPDKRVHRP